MIRKQQNCAGKTIWTLEHKKSKLWDALAIDNASVMILLPCDRWFSFLLNNKVFHVSTFFMSHHLMCNELCVYVNAVFMLCQLRVRVFTYTELDSVPTKYHGSETIDETSGQSYRSINE